MNWMICLRGKMSKMGQKLNSKKILKKIEEKKKDIGKYDVKKIGLFGSFAKDKQNKKSDIDFLIEFSKIDADKFFSLLFLLENMFKRKVDLVDIKRLRPELKYVKKEAKYVKI